MPEARPQRDETEYNGSPPAVAAALERLGVAPLVGDALDPVGLARALGRALGRALLDPRSASVLVRHSAGIAVATLAAAARALGVDVAAPLAPAPKDGRFAEPAWSENAGYYALLQAYLLNRQTFLELVERGATPEEAPKARFGAGLFADALAPTNFLPTNPAALRRAWETGGKSVARGWLNFLRDLRDNGGWPSQVDRSAFEVGRDLAATPGQVVYRNELIELIQYAPATEQVRETPLLICPPWINKYYIVDLAPGKSLVGWAVSHGLTTFVISFRNPDSSMRDVGFDDYLFKGLRVALDVVREISSVPAVNILSVCLGATLTTTLLAFLDATGERGLVRSSTTLNSLVDHSKAGALSSVFTDEAAVASLERKMARQGYLEARDMAHTFDLLRANDLVFNYVVSGWLMGQRPPAFDLLAWNADSTRMPAKMHSFYLRKCWVENALAEDRMELAGELLRVSEIDVDHYIVAAVEDHIVPWRNAYRTTQLLRKASCRFVLSSSGHIAGIVNPPSPKARYWTNDVLPADPEEWLRAATEHADTWWNDWPEWIIPRSGELRDPPAFGSANHPPLGPAPGTYVRG
ncbi:MAG TPA: alpha/beta fold hydrolase [Acidimicrobiales bacterium]|nr:alpha/beta fold hydrolase [Acidimicrobiales bacterium]